MHRPGELTYVDIDTFLATFLIITVMSTWAGHDTVFLRVGKGPARWYTHGLLSVGSKEISLGAFGL